MLGLANIEYWSPYYYVDMNSEDAVTENDD